MINKIKYFFTTSYNYVLDRLYSIAYFFKFLALIYKITHTDLTTLNYNQLNKLKSRIVNNGMVSLKFMQWYISRLENEDSEKYKEVLTEFDSIFDNCPYHSLEKTKDIFYEDYGLDIEKFIDLDSLNYMYPSDWDMTDSYFLHGG